MILNEIRPGAPGDSPEKDKAARPEAGKVELGQPRLHLVRNALAGLEDQPPLPEDTGVEDGPAEDTVLELERGAVDRMMELTRSLGGRAAGRSIRG